ncbi:hypothetical protein [Methylorubrum thiocyanatum]|uniref:hypothetical protein n=1 Tax=Methylorubrum thiocyanatum TaxID=47958 RepID=UPI003650301B
MSNEVFEFEIARGIMAAGRHSPRVLEEVLNRLAHHDKAAFLSIVEGVLSDLDDSKAGEIKAWSRNELPSQRRAIATAFGTSRHGWVEE